MFLLKLLRTALLPARFIIKNDPLSPHLSLRHIVRETHINYDYYLPQQSKTTFNINIKVTTMNTSNAIDFVFATSLTTFVVGGLLLAGMASAVIVGTVAAGAYVLATN